MNRYEKMTNADFARLLDKVVDDLNQRASLLLAVPGIYEVLSEYYNNEVLNEWDVEQAIK